MSLIGIDVGSSRIKAAAYRPDGRVLASAHADVYGRRPESGWWETDPEQVWTATLQCLGRISAAKTVKRDPPTVLAISASGREAFPVDRLGRALGPCLMAADMRGADIERQTAARASTLDWYEACGHIPERMDPVNRLLWWRSQHPQVMARTKRFLGWHEFLTLRLGGRAVTDHSLASKWLTYDLTARTWSRRLLDEFSVDPSLLPEIQTWGEIAAPLKRSVASELGLSHKVEIAVGGFDCTCAAIGLGVSSEGTTALILGSWADLIVPTRRPPSVEILGLGMSVGVHPGAAGLAVQALTPNGTTVLDWARSMFNIPLQKLEATLQQAVHTGDVLAVPHLSRATVPWKGGKDSRGALIGMTLATSRADIVRALLEGVSYDLTLTIRSLHQYHISTGLIRAAGGGTRSQWWIQLIADLNGAGVEVLDQPEPGCVGAALLAGSANGTYSSLEEGAKSCTSVARTYEPDPKRIAQYEQSLRAYQTTVSALLKAASSREPVHE